MELTAAGQGVWLQVPHSPLLLSAVPDLLQAILAAAGSEEQPGELPARLEAVTAQAVKSYAAALPGGPLALLMLQAVQSMPAQRPGCGRPCTDVVTGPGSLAAPLLAIIRDAAAPGRKSDTVRHPAMDQGSGMWVAAASAPHEVPRCDQPRSLEPSPSQATLR